MIMISFWSWAHNISRPWNKSPNLKKKSYISVRPWTCLLHLVQHLVEVQPAKIDLSKMWTNLNVKQCILEDHPLALLHRAY
jgi:hypothetical protein